VLIHDYAEDGNIAGVAGELGRSVDIEVRDKRSDRLSDYTPLMYAVTSAKAGPDMVRFLLKRGANPNAVHNWSDRIQENVLSLAVQAGNRDKATLVLDAGADIRYERTGRYNVLIDVMHRRNVARDPELLPIIRLLIDRGAKLNTESEHGESALSVASHKFNGRFDAVQVLLDAGSDPGPLEWTPLMRAIALGTLADVQTELDRGADLAATDRWSRTPWLLSLQVGDVPKAKLLLAAGASREDRGHCSTVPLMYPIANGHVDMLRWLLSEGVNPEDTDEFGDTPLMYAAEMGAAECAKVLMEAGADIHHVKDGREAIEMASSRDVVRLLVGRGADLNDINDDMRAALTNLPNDGRLYVSREEYLATKNRRFGTNNPEKMNFPFWKAMVTAGLTAWSVKDHFDDKEFNRQEIFCFRRFGKSINELPDGRIVEIAGEHEDYYDPDFCIYNDVIVHYGDGGFDIFGYPKEVFPPTDFHTATLAGEFIYIIGSLGYAGERRYGATQVHRLNIETLAIEEVRTSGDSPGWISCHKATLRDGHDIHIRCGKVCLPTSEGEDYVDNPSEYVLNLGTMAWHKETDYE
jgi:ankyrin repeat protein